MTPELMELFREGQQGLNWKKELLKHINKTLEEIPVPAASRSSWDLILKQARADGRAWGEVIQLAQVLNMFKMLPDALAAQIQQALVDSLAMLARD